MARKKENLFQQAKQAAEKAAPDAKPGSAVIAGLKKLAAFNTVVRLFTALRDTSEAEVKSAALDVALERGMGKRRRPDNFDLVDQNASAGFQIKQRSSRSALSEEEVALCNAHGIRVEKIVDRPAMYGVNPKYENDQAVLEKVSKFLVQHGLGDFVVMQTEVSRMTAAKESIDDVFTHAKTREQAAQLLPLVSSLALRIKDLETREALAIASRYLGEDQ